MSGTRADREDCVKAAFRIRRRCSPPKSLFLTDFDASPTANAGYARGTAPGVKPVIPGNLLGEFQTGGSGQRRSASPVAGRAGGFPMARKN